MPWTRPTFRELVERVEGDISSRLTGNAPLLRWTVLKILGRALAALAHIILGYISYLSNQILVTTAETTWLNGRAAERGITRLAATFAQGTILLTGTNGTSVPAGTTFISTNGMEYTTNSSAVLSSGAEVAITCTTAGEIGNLPASTPLNIKTPISGLDDECLVGDALTGGSNEETDVAFRARILADIQKPPAGGSESDYIKWAKSISGVENAWVRPNYYGRGSVAVIITAVGSDPEPSVGLVGDVQDYIDQPNIRPVTADVTVSAIEPVTVNIELSVTPINAGITQAIEENLASIFEADAEPGGILYLSSIQDSILRAGIRDYSIDVLEVDGNSEPIANFQFTAFQYMILDTVTISELV